MLAVRVVSWEPADHGWTMSGWQGSKLEADLDLDTDETTWLHWSLDRVAAPPPRMGSRSTFGPSSASLVWCRRGRTCRWSSRTPAAVTSTARPS